MIVPVGKEFQVDINFPQILLHRLLVSIVAYNLSVSIIVVSS